MQHLTPVGLSKDGKELVLISESGEEFAVPVDHRFRTALRGDQARLGKVEMKMESALRPRDIQSRIRGGETAEQVAAAAQTTVEAIMAFAAPVLAERAHVAQTALKSSIRRATTEASPVARTLDDASRQHLSAIGVRADDVEWDAWRREDGRWSLVAEYIAGDEVHQAKFSYDPPGRYVLAENDDARQLTGESVRAVATPDPGRRLSSVPSRSDVDELPLGDDAIELVREGHSGGHEGAAAEAVGQVPPSALSETVSAVREPSLTPGPVADSPDADHADADWITATTSDPVDSATATREPAPASEPVPEPEPASIFDLPDDSEPQSSGTEAPTAPAEEQTPPKRKGRSSVPSWDEIMFGGGKHE